MKHKIVYEIRKDDGTTLGKKIYVDNLGNEYIKAPTDQGTIPCVIINRSGEFITKVTT